MKASSVLSLVFLSVTVATLLHECKVKKQDPQDRVMAALEGVRQIVPPGSSISLRTEPSVAELMPWARYAMAPRFLDVSKGTDRYDTVLSIQQLAGSDSSLAAWSHNRRVIWQYRDSQFIYQLTTRH